MLRFLSIPALLLCLACTTARADGGMPSGPGSVGGGDSEAIALDPIEVRGLTVEERVGSVLPMELSFLNSEGKSVRLGDYFKTEPGKGGDASAFGGVGKPTVLMMVYYRCPVVCDVLMSKMAQTFEDIEFNLGSDYHALFFSIDDLETPTSSSTAKTKYASGYRLKESEATRAAAMQAWQFHTGDADSVKKLANSVGYQFRKLSNNEFSHPVVAFVLTPDGKLSRYLYGFKQEPRDLKLALMEASEGKLVRTIGDRILAFCYMYDPARGGYSLQAIRVMQLGGAVTMVGLAALVGVLLLGERMRKRTAAQSNLSTQTLAANGPGVQLFSKEGTP